MNFSHIPLDTMTSCLFTELSVFLVPVIQSGLPAITFSKGYITPDNIHNGIKLVTPHNLC